MAKVVKLCTVAGCGRKHVAHGLCNKHYKLDKRAKPLLDQWDYDEFWEFVKKELDIAI